MLFSKVVPMTPKMKIGPQLEAIFKSLVYSSLFIYPNSKISEQYFAPKGYPQIKLATSGNEQFLDRFKGLQKKGPKNFE